MSKKTKNHVFFKPLHPYEFSLVKNGGDSSVDKVIEENYFMDKVFYLCISLSPTMKSIFSARIKENGGSVSTICHREVLLIGKESSPTAKDIDDVLEPRNCKFLSRESVKVINRKRKLVHITEKDADIECTGVKIQDESVSFEWSVDDIKRRWLSASDISEILKEMYEKKK